MATTGFQRYRPPRAGSSTARVARATHMPKAVVTHPSYVRAAGGMRKANAFMGRHHTAISVGGGAITAGMDYHHSRQLGLNKKQAVGVASIGTAGAAASMYATHKAHLGWKGGLAVDTATGMASMKVQDRLAKHYERKNQMHSVRH